jgi:hypothetical protein
VEELFTKDYDRGNMHGEIVSKIIPRFAERLKKEQVISDYGRQHFEIRVFNAWCPVKIRPDLILFMSNSERILVEVANPRDPKRFIGELVYPRLLGCCEQISAVFIFILCPTKRSQVHKRVLLQSWMLADTLKTKIPCVTFSWTESEEVNYKNLQFFLKTTYPYSKNKMSVT